MKPITSVFVLLVTLFIFVSPSLGNILYSLTPAPVSAITWNDLRTGAHYNTPLTQPLTQVHGINGLDPRSDSIIEAIVSFDTNSISLIQIDMVHGNTSTLSTVSLPTGVKTDQILSFSPVLDNPTECIFLTQVGKYITLNNASWTSEQLSSITITPAPLEQLQIVENVSIRGTFLIAGINNRDQFVFYWADFYHGATQKAIIFSPDQRPKAIYELLSVQDDSYVIEYDSEQFIFNRIDWSSQKLISVHFMNSIPAVEYFKLYSDRSIGVLVASASSNSILQTFETPSLGDQTKEPLPNNIPLDASIFFKFFQN